jgi:alkyl hydroperoxide reductase subunit F
MLDTALKEQLQSIFSNLEGAYVLDITAPSQHENRSELLELLDEVAASSEKISCQVKDGNQ